jgi:hypothetical protein
MQTASNFEWFDPWSKAHCEMVDIRFNQSMLVGAAVSRLDGTDDYASGRTIREGVLALVPRAVWPDKPMIAGSGNLVSEFTGIRFAEGTTIGVGQVLECFINFGTVGVVIGFLLLGTFVTLFDYTAGQALVNNDWLRFATAMMLGICLLNIIGSLAETFTSAAACIVVMFIMREFGVPVLDQILGSPANNMPVRLGALRRSPLAW